MLPSIIYLSKGRLFLKEPEQEIREIESAFARQVAERQEKDHSVHGWKESSGVWGSMGMAAPDLGDWQPQGPRRSVQFLDMSRGEEKRQIYYTLDLGTVGGLFRYDLDKQRELRLMHREGFRAVELAHHPREDLVAFSVFRQDGTIGLTIAENEGRRHNQVSGGDSIDECPAWIEGKNGQLVFQSAGVGRDQQGFRVGLGPYGIEILDIKRGDVTNIVSSDTEDYLSPRILNDETMLFIRRPYKGETQGVVSFWGLVKDLVLFPYRVIRAFVYFLNFMSIMFSGQPLMTAGGAPRDMQDPRFLSVWGRMVDTKRAMERAENNGNANLVPNDWELIRRNDAGTDEVLANGVLCYDVNASGDIVYSNGSKVFYLNREGDRTEVCKDSLIEKVLIVDD